MKLPFFVLFSFLTASSALNSSFDLGVVNGSRFFLNAVDCISFTGNSSFFVCALNQTTVIEKNVTTIVNQTVYFPQVVNNTVTQFVNISTQKRFDRLVSLNLSERFFDYDSNLTVECPQKLFLERVIQCGEVFEQPSLGLKLFVQNRSECVACVNRTIQLPPDFDVCTTVYKSELEGANFTQVVNASCVNQTQFVSSFTKTDKEEIAKLAVDGFQTTFLVIASVVGFIAIIANFIMGKRQKETDVVLPGTSEFPERK